MISQPPRKTLIAIIALLILGNSSAFAQQKVRIYGKVLDSNKQAVELVAIALDNAMRGTTSDSNGNYEIEVTRRDSITLVFSRLGYLQASYTVPCSQDLIFSPILELASHQMAALEVQEDRLQSVRMNKIDAKASSIVPDASGSGVEALITTLTGVSTTNEMSSQYSVRGGNFDENLVYVNGVEIYRPILIRSGQQEGLSFINPALVSNISFSSGGFSLRTFKFS